MHCSLRSQFISVNETKIRVQLQKIPDTHAKYSVGEETEGKRWKQGRSGNPYDIMLLTFDIQVERVAFSVALGITRYTGVQAGDVPNDRLQDQCLVAQDDPCARVVV
jgi:hypothetical protein